MVLEFLRAEVDSPRFGSHVAGGLVSQASTREELIDNGDLRDVRQNDVRAAVLGYYRGYPDTRFFKGFPSDTLWTRCSLSPDELKNARYARIIEWLHVSRYTQLVSVAVQAIAQGDIESISSNYYLNQSESNMLHRLVENIRSVASDYKQGKRYPKLIAVRVDTDVVLLEGYTRATGFVLSELKGPIEMLIGSSKGMRSWAPLTETIL
jgi:hypothetical protein